MPLENLEEELESVEFAKKPVDSDVKTPKEVYAKIIKFTNEARKLYGDIIKSVLIFGSAAKGTMVKGSDADVYVVLDDTVTKTSEDLDKVTTQLHLIAHDLKDVHVQTATLTEFWQWVKQGSPELVNYLRYGLVVYDTGFTKPIQRMLQMGLIPPSEETISLKARTAEARYRKIKLDIKSMIFELRYTSLDIVQAVAMHYFKATPDYKAAPEYLEKLIKSKKLEKIYLKKFIDLDKLWKDIDHKVIKNVTTDHLDTALKISSEIIQRFKKLLPEDLRGEDLPEED